MRITTIAAATALGAALLGGAAPPTSAQTGGSVITGAFDVGPGGEPGNFNPLDATAGFTWLSLYFEPLVIYDAKLVNIVGDLAPRFEVSADQTSYTFHLAQTRWHDGQPFTSADVAFTLGLARNGATGSIFAARLGAIKTIETPDDHTVTLHLSAPNASLMDTLTKVMMLPRHALSAIPAAELPRNRWWSTTPIGTGPFRFVRYVNNQFVTLAENPDYRGGKPKVDRLINRYFENTAGAVAALRAGEIQFSYVESDDAASFRNQPGFRV
ncbi:MAG: ABC transporter substrate-binding protein, partial [Acetobacteraceae bacterium]